MKDVLLDIENNRYRSKLPRAVCFLSHFNDEGIEDKRGYYLDTLGIFGRLYLPENDKPFFEYSFQEFDHFFDIEKEREYFIARELQERIKECKYYNSKDRIYFRDPDWIKHYMMCVYRDFILEPAAITYCRWVGLKYSAPAVFGNRMGGGVYFIPYMPHVEADDITDPRHVLRHQEQWQMYQEGYPGRHDYY